MKFLKSRVFWLTLAHIGIIGSGAALSILFPPAGVAIMSATSLANAALASPLVKK